MSTRPNNRSPLFDAFTAQENVTMRASRCVEISPISGGCGFHWLQSDACVWLFCMRRECQGPLPNRFLQTLPPVGRQGHSLLPPEIGRPLERSADFLIAAEDLPTHPYWPGGESGITIGVGWDLGQHSESEFLRAWAALDQTTLGQVK